MGRVAAGGWRGSWPSIRTTPIWALSGSDGSLFCSAVPFLGPIDLSDRRYFQDALQSGGLSIGEFQIGRVTGRPGVNLGYPAIDADGRTVAIAYVAVDLAWIEAFASSAELPPGGTLTVFDRNGTILARYPDGEQWVGRVEPTAEVVRLAQTAAPEGSVQGDGFDGVEKIFGVVRLAEDRSGQPVYLSVGLPLAQVYADVRTLERDQLITLLVAIAAALISGWYLSDVVILRRVEGLIGATRGIAEGRLDTRLKDGGGGDELGLLTREFDRMASRLERHEHELREALDKLRRTNRALTLLSECNQILVRETHDMTLAQKICEKLVEVGGFRLAWVGEVRQDPAPAIVPVAVAGPAAGYLEKANFLVNDDDPAPGPAVIAFRTGEPAVVRDVGQDASFAAWREQAARFGFQSSIALPLRRDGRRLGVVCMYADHPEAYDEAEVRLMRELADDLSYGLEAIRADAARQRAEAALQRLSTYYESLVVTMSEGLVVEDAGGTITYANPAAARMLERPIEEIEGKHWRKIIPEDQHAAVAAANERRAAGGSDKYEVEIEGKDGRRRRLQVSGAPRFTLEGFDGTLAVFSDVTGEREARRRTELQDRLAAVGQLAAGVAHDFNNIVGAILLYGEMLLAEKGLSDKARDRVQTITEQAHRAAELTQQILDFGRRTIVERRPVDLVQQVREFTRMIDRAIPETIRVRLEHREPAYIVAGDPGRLQQVLMNLAINARDSMPEGGEIVFRLDRIRVEPGAPPYRDMPAGDWVLLTVSDSGTGIPDTVLPHVFEPFFTTKPTGEGTGLGLAQVYGIVKQHDGFVDARSVVGYGTTFLIYLPASETPFVGEMLEAGPEHYRGSGELILLVEDDEAARGAMADALTDLNYTVLLAKDGEEAIRIIRESSRDIAALVTDVVMPRMGGLQLHAALRAGRPELRALFVTGYPLGADTRELLEAGRADWLQKPFDSQTLGRRLRRLLDTPGGAGPQRQGLERTL